MEEDPEKRISPAHALEKSWFKNEIIY